MAWLRAQDRFLDEFLGVLGTDAGVEAAVSVLTWSAAHPDDAELLLRFALRGHRPGTRRHHARAGRPPLRVRSAHPPTDANMASLRRAATLLLD